MTGLPKASAIALVVGAGLWASAVAPATSVPVRVTDLDRNDRISIQVSGFILSPPNASTCRAVVRATLQVRAPGGWRTVKRVGSHRINVCQRGTRGWTSGSFYTRFTGTANLRRQKARACVSATQRVNGRVSKHIACKRFTIHRTRPSNRGSRSPGL